MTSKAAITRNPDGKHGVGTWRICINMAREATATSVFYGIQGVFCLVMTQMTTGAELSQQRIGRGVREVREVSLSTSVTIFIKNITRDEHHSFASMHETLGYV